MRRIALLFVAMTAATLINGCGTASVGSTRLVSVTLARGCRLSLRLPQEVRATVDRANARQLRITGPGIPKRAAAVCVLGHSAKFMQHAVYDPRATNVQRLRHGGFISVLTTNGGSVGYMVDIRGGTFFIANSGDSVSPTLAYLVRHAHGGFHL
jgi:hypothetical protein